MHLLPNQRGKKEEDQYVSNEPKNEKNILLKIESRMTNQK